MYTFLKERGGQIKGSAQGRTDMILEGLASFKKSKGKKGDFLVLAREYISTLEGIT